MGSRPWTYGEYSCPKAPKGEYSEPDSESGNISGPATCLGVGWWGSHQQPEVTIYPVSALNWFPLNSEVSDITIQGKSTFSRIWI